MKILAFVLLVFSVSAYATDERHYQKVWCDGQKGEMEFVLPDKTRVDCLTPSLAVEVDFAKKWAEAVGQALHYASWTGRRAGIVLIIGPGDDHLVRRLYRLVSHYNLPIDILTVRR